MQTATEKKPCISISKAFARLEMIEIEYRRASFRYEHSARHSAENTRQFRRMSSLESEREMLATLLDGLRK